MDPLTIAFALGVISVAGVMAGVRAHRMRQAFSRSAPELQAISGVDLDTSHADELRGSWARPYGQVVFVVRGGSAGSVGVELSVEVPWLPPDLVVLGTRGLNQGTVRSLEAPRRSALERFMAATSDLQASGLLAAAVNVEVRTGFATVTVNLQRIEDGALAGWFALADDTLALLHDPTQQTDPLCPVCQAVFTEAVDPAGHRCGECLGVLLDATATSTVVLEPRAMSPADLKTKAEGASGAGVICPLCRRQMAPVLLEDVVTDVCVGCGAMWLERGELSAISLNRYRG